MAEFTGERVIPGQVDIDLLNEHMARYTFAARLARGKRVLDAGCGAGYGSAELAQAALSVVGVDVAPEAVDHARTNYAGENISFEQASCTSLPHPDASFDLVVAFEVIEHLEDWRGFLNEARRVLAPGGQLIVSTPNKLYYTDSRGESGANPFHVHEFTFDEFREELRQVFAYVNLFLENHVEGVSFQPHDSSNTVDVRVDSGEPVPDESHFFVAVCAHRPQIGNPTYVYVPRAANVLREREMHIALLERELATKNQWLEKALAEHQSLMKQFAGLEADLERSNLWAADQDKQIKEQGTRIVQLQEELQTVTDGYSAQVAELERDLKSKIEWALNLKTEVEKQTAALANAVDVLHQTEKELEERSAWAIKLSAQVDDLSHQLALVRGSRWVRLGRKVGLGPSLPPA